MNQAKPSSIVGTQVQQIGQNQLEVPSWFIMVVLICAFIVLKKFLYIKDPKRDGK